jgi:CRISPR-associated protein Csb2
MTMLAIEVEYLMGRTIAADSADRSLAEWPPHPQRLFSALVAAHEELQLDAQSESALLWLERQPAPAITADPFAAPRDVRPHFVPVNDELLDAKAQDKRGDRLDPLSLRGSRARQSRFFPAVVPSLATVIFLWSNSDPPPDTRRALDRLLSELTYLGHSSSPVRATLTDGPSEPVWRPDERGDEEFRVPGPGRLERLRAVHAMRQDNESIAMPVGRTQRYSTVSHGPKSVFGPARVLAITNGPQPGITLGLEATIPVMQQLRAALLHCLGKDIPEVLSGHNDRGKPSTHSHLALLPLAHVGGQYGDGSVKGFGFMLPRAVDEQVLLRLEEALERLDRLNLGGLGVLHLEPAPSRDGLAALNFRQRYVGRSAQTWTSVTPVVLDRHPKPGCDIEHILNQSCLRIGLPKPELLYVGNHAQVRGAPRADRYQAALKYMVGSGREPPSSLKKRLWRHVQLRFHEPVTGPVVLGAGRFFGYGLFMPDHRQDRS